MNYDCAELRGCQWRYRDIVDDDMSNRVTMLMQRYTIIIYQCLVVTDDLSAIREEQ